MTENKIKKPMSKAKKEFISSFIWLAAGIMFIIAGIISLTIVQNKAWNLALGIVFIVCGTAIVGFAIYLLIKSKKIMDKEKITPVNDQNHQ